MAISQLHMRISKILVFIIISLIFVFAIFSCDTNDDAGQIINNNPTTFEIIANSPDHTTLEQALVNADLVDVLNSGTFTVFAPTDDAFSTIDLGGFSSDDIRNILLNHVITGNVESTDLANGYYKTNAAETYSGDDNKIDIYVNVDGGVVLNASATVTSPDLTASNGTIHVVDQVISIPHIVTLAAANPNFSNLETALIQENLVTTLSSDASPAPFTVFAPSDTAFQAFLDESTTDNLETIDDVLSLPFLSEVLTYHVLGNTTVRSGEITDGLTPVTLQTETITLNTSDGVTITDQNGRVVNVISTDVTGSNGVIHVLDNVILPTLP